MNSDSRWAENGDILNFPARGGLAFTSLYENLHASIGRPPQHSPLSIEHSVPSPVRSPIKKTVLLENSYPVVDIILTARLSGTHELG